MQLQRFEHVSYTLVRPLFNLNFQRITRVYGADGVFLIAPYFNLYSQDAAVAYYQDIAAEFPDTVRALVKESEPLLIPR